MFKDKDADLYVLLFAKHSAKKDLDPNISFWFKIHFKTISRSTSRFRIESRDKPKS